MTQWTNIGNISIGIATADGCPSSRVLLELRRSCGMPLGLGMCRVMAAKATSASLRGRLDTFAEIPTLNLGEGCERSFGECEGWSAPGPPPDILPPVQTPLPQ